VEAEGLELIRFRLKHYRSPEPVEGRFAARRASTGSALRFYLNGNSPYREGVQVCDWQNGPTQPFTTKLPDLPLYTTER
jgi:hypothetical protein